jgi:hypothetical protein
LLDEPILSSNSVPYLQDAYSVVSRNSEEIIPNAMQRSPPLLMRHEGQKIFRDDDILHVCALLQTTHAKMFALTLSFAGLASAQLLGGLLNGGPSPIVKTSYASFQGKQDIVTGTSNYLGIPYAHAPRFDHARLFNDQLSGVQQATQYGDVCPQHLLVPSIVAPDIGGVGEAISFVEALPLAQDVYQESEDCLSINIQRPQDQSLKDLPVVLWIHGGGFEVGASAAIGVDGTVRSDGNSLSDNC